MERDLDILMLRQQIEEEPVHQQQIQKQVWSYGEKPVKTPRVSQNMPQSLPNATQSSIGNIQNKKFTRDAINTRMGDRDLLVQVGGNPFLSNNNYVNDIANRDQYLVARDSNFN
jgi:hypothetical protein